jgi:hypothetical protein
MMERMYAEMKAMQQKMDANQAKTYANQAKTDVTLREIKAGHDAWIQETKAGQKAIEACPEKMEANPEKLKSVTVNEEVPKEGAAVETFGALKKRYGDST